jgi:hypothetical protein
VTGWDWFDGWHATHLRYPEQINPARWGEPMSAAYRGMVLVYYLKTEEIREDIDAELVSRLRSVIRTPRDFLADPANFNRNSNHGMVVVPELPFRFHGDVLSVYYRSRGETILGDPGKYEYTPSELRDYFKSMHAHNTIFPRTSWSSTPELARKTNYGESGDRAVFTAEVSYQGEFVVTRTVDISEVEGGADGKRCNRKDSRAGTREARRETPRASGSGGPEASRALENRSGDVELRLRRTFGRGGTAGGGRKTGLAAHYRRREAVSFYPGV